ncbi:hypothetical protein VE03_07229 [Pseudogymnoascus sp. 23342-1-I1]|nr:hypothetical protein VE03_07229 [Pseudogymnoascus sp. 23342-1-I1]
MHIATLLVVALTTAIATAIAPELITLAPRAQRTGTPDPWQCISENVTQYLDVPKPTGSLFDEIKSYAVSLYEPCLASLTATCPFPAQSDWCAFTTAAPKDVLPAYSSYASQAHSWWEAHSSVIASAKEMCPNNWANGLWRNAGSEEWLNDTIAFAGCYAEALTMTGSTPTALATEGAKTSELTATSRSGAAVGSATPTSTDALNGASADVLNGGNLVGAEKWMAALAGFAGVAVGCEW